jgi:transaldolase
MSIHPSYQEPFVSQDFPRQARIDRPVPADVIERLQQMPDFRRAYEPDGMTPVEFVTYGVSQRTLSQFGESWKQMESYK